MPRALGLALLMLCLTVASAAGTTAWGQSSPAGEVPTASWDVEILTLGGEARTAFADQSIDVSTAVGTQQSEARSRLDREALAVEFEGTEGEQARRELLFEAATEVEIEISELRTEQRELRTSYVSGDVSTATFVRRQVTIDARAEQLRFDLEAIRGFADEVPRVTMNSRIASLLASLTGLDGPVTTRAESAINGEEPPVRLYVATSTNGTTLSTIDGIEYVRQGFRSDFWTPDSSSGIPLDDVENLAGELYPVAFNPPQVSSRGIANVPPDRVVDTGIYRINIVHQQGEIVAYLDGDTRQVFYETQRQPLDQIEPGSAATAVQNDTRLVVNQTFEGGPLRVSVADNRTGEPASVDVSVGEVPLETGSDGVVWTLMPAQTTRVTAVTERGNVSLLVGPVQPPRGNTTATMADLGLRKTANSADTTLERSGRP